MRIDATRMYYFLKTEGCVQVVVVANDITFNSGSFGPREDAVFKAATEYALEERLPLIYLAANSGARVGLSDEIKQRVKVTAPNFPLAAELYPAMKQAVGSLHCPRMETKSRSSSEEVCEVQSSTL